MTFYVFIISVNIWLTVSTGPMLLCWKPGCKLQQFQTESERSSVIEGLADPMRNITLIHTVIHLLESLHLSAIISSLRSPHLSFLLPEHWDDMLSCLRLWANQMGKCLQVPIRWAGDLHESITSINQSRRATECCSDPIHFPLHFQPQLRPYSPFFFTQIKHLLLFPAVPILIQTIHPSPPWSQSKSVVT